VFSDAYTPAYVLTRKGYPVQGEFFRYYDGWFERYLTGVLMRIRLEPVPEVETTWFCNQDSETESWVEMGAWLLDFEQAEKEFGSMEIPQKECLPGLELPPLTERSPLREDRKYPVWRLGRMIPEDLRKAVAPYAYEGFRLLAVYKVLGEPWREFASQHTALAWLLAIPVPYEEMTPGSPLMQELLGILAEGEDFLIRWLDLPAEPWLKECLQRFTGDAPFQVFMGALLKLEVSPRSRRFLKHGRPLDQRFLEFILYAEPSQVSADLMREVLSPDFHSLDFKWVRACLEDTAGAQTNGAKVPRFRSALHLDRWHREQAVLFGRTGFYTNPERGKFPRIPNPGTRYIIPLKSWEEVDREIYTLGHYELLKYNLASLEGPLGFFILLKPERATLAFQRKPGQRWICFYFRSAYGREPGEEAKNIVRRWFFG
jgi:hypothetical protein